jgi:hypothetical protein
MHWVIHLWDECYEGGIFLYYNPYPSKTFEYFLGDIFSPHVPIGYVL